MHRAEVMATLAEGYYGDTLETDEVYGILARHFPEVVSEDKTLEEMVAEACFDEGGK